MATNFHIGQRVSFESAACTIRYIGPVEGFQKEWLGVEWDDPSRGKHDGVVNGVRYFECQNPSPTVASFVRPTRKPDLEQSFVDAVHQKYATGVTARQSTAGAEKQIMISGGKVAEEVGFDKIRAQLAQLNELKIVLVDGLQIATAETPDKLIKDVCPKIIELDLSRNLFSNCREIARICNELDNLRLLRLNGNRLTVKLEDLLIAPAALEGLQELEMDETYLSFSTICQIAKRSRSLKTLTASSNGLETLDAVEPDPYRHFETGNFPIGPGTTLESAEYGLTSISLEYNNFTLLSDLLPLTNFQALEKLHLKGNKISKIQNSIKRDSGGHDTSIKVVFGRKLRYVDLSYNAVETWSFLDDLAVTFPGLTALRFSHNPLYDTIAQAGGTAVGVEDGYMLTLARLAKLETLNFSNITPAERTNAEIFYLSTIGKELAEVQEDEERKITSRHKRYQELCEIYGAPTVIRKAGRALDLEFLESRLIKFTFFRKLKTSGGKDEIIEKSAEVPKGFDIYKVKGLIGKLFCVRPLSIRLIWETGEWDPVAGYEEQEYNSEEEDEKPTTSEAELTKGSNHGKWMKREVELEDSTRQVGFCVDGMDARVRIEER